MPRYYFDVWNGDRVAQDNEGVECVNDKAACSAATRALLNLAKDMVEATSRYELSIEISDQRKQPLFRATLQFEIEPLGGAREIRD
jgi:hypothetical protein